MFLHRRGSGWRAVVDLVHTCAALLCAALFVAPLGSAHAQSPRISPELRMAAERAHAEGVHVPIILRLRERIDVPGTLAEVAPLDRNARRALATQRLREAHQPTQAWLVSRLRAEAVAGRVTSLRPLWIVNAILARVDPGLLVELAELPEVERILWDPSIPHEEAYDPLLETESSRGGEDVARGTELWQLESVFAPAAWALGYQGQGIVVAVIDNGVLGSHPDLSSHLWNNDDEIPGNGVDDDSNGYIDDTWGWDFWFGDNEPSPSGDDHGTKCAGLVAGDGTLGTRTGVAPQAQIMSLKVDTWGQNAEAIQYAIENGADIISMSRSQKWRFVPKPDYEWWRALSDAELLVGIFHANSIGNEGDNAATDPIPFNISAPGNCPAPWRHPQQVPAGVSGITASVGAIDELDQLAIYSSLGPATWEDIGAHWPSYPFGMRPEYRDYPFSFGRPGLLKPDLVAPGPNTTSIAFGDTYGVFGGTSAATPHLAGAMALLLNANPDLAPDEMAFILQMTAADLGPAGKDLYFGAGRLDCLAAVQLAEVFDEYGAVSGVVAETGSGDPVYGALVEAGNHFAVTDAQGRYSLALPSGVYTLSVHSFFHEPSETPLVIVPMGLETVDDTLVALPVTTLTGTIRDQQTGLPVPDAMVSIPASGLPAELTGANGRYTFASVSEAQHTLRIERIGYRSVEEAVDVGAPSGGLSFVWNRDLEPALFAFDMETDPEWTVGDAGDGAITGVWTRVDPNGNGAQPEDDHTPGSGTHCWVTEQAPLGGLPGGDDVDGGTTTLTSHIFDLSGTIDPTVSYWLWYSNNAGSAIDDECAIQISADAGESWVDLLRSSVSNAFWSQYSHRISDYVPLTDSVLVRFIASDLGNGSIVEAGIDDVQIEDTPVAADAPDVHDRPVTMLLPGAPNPFRSGTWLRFRLAHDSDASLSVYDVAGRRTRTLLRSVPVAGGNHAIRWDGLDDGGRKAASGVYFIRLATDEGVYTERVVRLD